MEELGMLYYAVLHGLGVFKYWRSPKVLFGLLMAELPVAVMVFR